MIDSSWFYNKHVTVFFWSAYIRRKWHEKLGLFDALKKKKKKDIVWINSELLFFFSFVMKRYRPCRITVDPYFMVTKFKKLLEIKVNSNAYGVSVWRLSLRLTWRCPWCNGYRHRIWTRRYEFNSWTRLIAFHIALIPLGKVWIQLFSLQLWVNSRAD